MPVCPVPLAEVTHKRPAASVTVGPAPLKRAFYTTVAPRAAATSEEEESECDSDSESAPALEVLHDDPDSDEELEVQVPAVQPKAHVINTHKARKELHSRVLTTTMNVADLQQHYNSVDNTAEVQALQSQAYRHSTAVARKTVVNGELFDLKKKLKALDAERVLLVQECNDTAPAYTEITRLKQVKRVATTIADKLLRALARLTKLEELASSMEGPFKTNAALHMDNARRRLNDLVPVVSGLQAAAPLTVKEAERQLSLALRFITEAETECRRAFRTRARAAAPVAKALVLPVCAPKPLAALATSSDEEYDSDDSAVPPPEDMSPVVA